MAINIEMPKLSDTMTEGTVVKWLKKVGEQVEIGDEIAEIETDKATMAMEAFDEGTLSEILIEEGSKAPVGAALAVLAEEDEPAGEQAAPAAPTGSEPTPAVAEPVPVVAEPVQVATEPAEAAREQAVRFKASPLARKMAAAEGVDLGAVAGTGPGGRIVKRDIEAFLSGGPVRPAVPMEAPEEAVAEPLVEADADAPAIPPTVAVPPKAAGEGRKIELSSLRRIIAERLQTSKTTIPHFYLHVEADAANLMDIRSQVNAQAEATHGNKYTVNDFILKAVINALQAVPAANASFNGDHIVQYDHIGIAVAVAVEDGLVTPVVKNAETKSLLQISREVKDLAARARDGKLRPDEFDGGTMTVSNLGSFGIESFDAIINPPQAAILSVGAIIEKPVVSDGAVVPGLRMNLGLSGDHRVVDGAVGARFLAEIKKLIENPALMLV
jgi:pyruvate dehydrogenase E2 component (dihydrolipoamide acetyltransferase)